ncbi:MAG: hypothetical protein LBH58_06045, partial [Tannerellaceae bacterium]|nr:hypothetical protein [Tannerellaceae bacterium]
ESNHLHNPLITQKESTYENREAEYYANLQTDYQLNNRSIIVSYFYKNKLKQVWILERTNDHLREIESSKGEPTSIGFRLSYNFGNVKVKQNDQRNTSNSDVKWRIN